MSSIAGLLARPRAPLAVVALALFLLLPSLFSGSLIDDHFHRAVLSAQPVAEARSRWGMFAFVDQDESRTRRLADLGVFPWWLGERTRMAFFRPLSELTHRADYALWPGRALAMHAHSLAWAALLFLAAAALYRQLLGPGLRAGLATALYALDDAQGLRVAWIANRNALLAAFFGLLCLRAHDRSRREGSRVSAVLAPLWLLASLCSAEAGIATLAFTLAHALALDPAPRARRAIALLPQLFVVCAWRAAISWLGYGVRGSGLYIDPLRDALRFLRAFAERAPVLLAGQWGPVPADIDGLVTSAGRAVEVLCALALLAVFALALAPSLRRAPVARFFVLGTLFAVVPCCATLPSDRLLGFVGFGAAGVLAVGIPGLLAPGVSRARRAFGLALVFVHLVLAPVALPFRAYSPALFARFLDRCMVLPDDPTLAMQHVVLVNALDVCAAYLPLRARFEGRTAPLRASLLTSGVAPVTVARDGERSLRVRRDDGWFSVPTENVFVDPGTPWRVGARRVLPGVRVEVLALTSDGRPREVRFEFDRALEDPSLRWVRLSRGSLVPMAPPRVVGAAVTLPSGYE